MSVGSFLKDGIYQRLASVISFAENSVHDYVTTYD
jgi:hypothetical protein